MQALKTLVGMSQIVFGTDAPFFDGAPQLRGLQTAGFTAGELARVERANALALLPVSPDPLREGISVWRRTTRNRSSNS